MIEQVFAASRQIRSGESLGELPQRERVVGSVLVPECAVDFWAKWPAFFRQFPRESPVMCVMHNNTSQLLLEGRVLRAPFPLVHLRGDETPWRKQRHQHHAYTLWDPYRSLGDPYRSLVGRELCNFLPKLTVAHT